jgi:dipeptidyl aminopeptidase/acylaminoacyl peptidase
MKMVGYAAADGLKMEGVLTLPPGRPAKALPAVILPHGGPRYHDTVGFDWIAQAFASRGYAVFQPNFRGSTGYGDEFERAGNGEWGRKMQTDISDGLAELVRQGLVDPKRVCIVGASYGGYAALAGVTLQHGLYRCAVAIAGISDVYRMVNDEVEESNSDPMLIRNLKQELGQGRDLKAVSPVRFADKVDVPVLLIHGKDDTVVHFSQSTAMAEALRHAGKPVEFVTLTAEDHWLSKGETRLQMLQSSVDFVMRNNPPDPAPATQSPN